MDELRALKAAHHEAMRAVTSTSLNEEDKVNQVTAFRLATDAITSQYQPLWTEMEKPIMEAYQQVKNAALERRFTFIQSSDQCISGNLFCYSTKFED